MQILQGWVFYVIFFNVISSLSASFVSFSSEAIFSLLHAVEK
ncbi:hypothetical protein CHCC20333_4670 [Bacillus paralicheniformis]|nr:hypothetical protein CHCC20333_4670 [Bacillus paralicheniformis]